MTCWALFQEEPPQDTVRIVNDGPIEPLNISCLRQVLKGWMISQEVAATPKPSNQPFQPTPVRRGGVYPPCRRRIQDGSDGRHFSYQLQLPQLKALESKHP